ncbi:MAG: Flp pilus assembly protein CpaB [Planctomycetaceae bacterium]
MKNLTPAKLVGLVFALLVMLIVGFVVKRMFAEEQVEEGPGGTIMPTALANLEVGTVIQPEHLGRARFSQQMTGDELLSIEAIVGRVVKRRIESAVPIHAGDLFPLGQTPSLAVSSGYRAMTIKVAEEQAILNGLLHPGQHVDIHWTPNALNQSDPRMQAIGALSMVLFQGVQVLAINKSFVQAPLEATQNSITVEVAENDASLLRLAEAHGTITVAYTSDSSGRAMVQVADPNRATLEELLGLDPVDEEPESTPDPPFVSTVYRGSGMQRSAFRNGVPLGNYNYDADLNRPVTPAVQGTPSGIAPDQPAAGTAPGQPAGAAFQPQTSTGRQASPTAVPVEQQRPADLKISARLPQHRS